MPTIYGVGETNMKIETDEILYIDTNNLKYFTI